MKPCDVLKVKNALVKFLYHVTEYNIGSFLVTEVCVYCAVQTESLNLIEVKFDVQTVSSLKYMNVPN